MNDKLFLVVSGELWSDDYEVLKGFTDEDAAEGYADATNKMLNKRVVRTETVPLGKAGDKPTWVFMATAYVSVYDGEVTGGRATDDQPMHDVPAEINEVRTGHINRHHPRRSSVRVVLVGETSRRVELMAEFNAQVNKVQAAVKEELRK